MALEGHDSLTIIIRQVDIVPAVQQLITADRVNRKRTAPVGAADRLPLQVDVHFLRRIGRDGSREFGNLCFGNNGRQQSILDRVLREDIAERWRDDAAEAVVVERIDGRLA